MKRLSWAFVSGLLAAPAWAQSPYVTGVIGERVADAVRAQPDIVLIGVSDVVTDYRIKTADVLGLRVFASLPEKAAAADHL